MIPHRTAVRNQLEILFVLVGKLNAKRAKYHFIIFTLIIKSLVAYVNFTSENLNVYIEIFVPRAAITISEFKPSDMAGFPLVQRSPYREGF